MERVVWQPYGLYQPGRDFGVLLDREFARGMEAARPKDGFLTRINMMGAELLKRQGHRWSEPYLFFEDSALITQLYLGENGVWLAAEDLAGRSPLDIHSEQIPFHSHNVDNTSQAYSLMALLDMWVEYSDILKEK